MLRTRTNTYFSSVSVADSLESELSAAKDRPLLRRARRREWQLLEDTVPADRGRVGLADEGEDVEVLGDRVLVAEGVEERLGELEEATVEDDEHLVRVGVRVRVRVRVGVRVSRKPR